MLSAHFIEAKRLRTAGKHAEAQQLAHDAPPQSDDDAFESLVCGYMAGALDALAQLAAARNWTTTWGRSACHALLGAALGRELRTALNSAREAVAAIPGHADVVAVYLILLQMNGEIDEAADYVTRHLAEPPRNEGLLLTVLGEVALTIGNEMAAYSLAASALGLDPHNTRALQISSMANFALGNVHEALGNAIHADKVKPGDPRTALQLMKCHNKLADFYSTIAAYDAVKSQPQLAPEIHAQLGYAYARLDDIDQAIACYRRSLQHGQVSSTALRGLIRIFINTGRARELDEFLAQYRDQVRNDGETLNMVALERLRQRDLPGAHGILRRALEVCSEQGLGYTLLNWPVPEPRLRHDLEQLELLAQRGKLAGSGVHALNVLRHYGRSQPDRAARYAPPGEEGAQLRRALAEYHHCPDPPFSGTTLGNNDYSAIEDGFMRSSPKLAVIDNFLSPAALAALREYCEEATIWKSYFDNGYVGTLFGSGFCPRVLLAIADEMKMMMPRVIGDYPLMQAWAFKYDQRLTGINMHADFAKVNVNFWITPDDACVDKNTGGLVIYDVPAPREWTYEDYNGKSPKQAAFLAVHHAKAQRVPYRENRCIVFDSTLFHTTDEIHFAPGYTNRRVNVTLLYGTSLNAD